MSVKVCVVVTYLRVSYKFTEHTMDKTIYLLHESLFKTGPCSKYICQTLYIL